MVFIPLYCGPLPRHLAYFVVCLCDPSPYPIPVLRQAVVLCGCGVNLVAPTPLLSQPSLGPTCLGPVLCIITPGDMCGQPNPIVDDREERGGRKEVGLED